MEVNHKKEPSNRHYPPPLLTVSTHGLSVPCLPHSLLFPLISTPQAAPTLLRITSPKNLQPLSSPKAAFLSPLKSTAAPGKYVKALVISLSKYSPHTVYLDNHLLFYAVFHRSIRVFFQQATSPSISYVAIINRAVFPSLTFFPSPSSNSSTQRGERETQGRRGGGEGRDQWVRPAEMAGGELERRGDEAGRMQQGPAKTTNVSPSLTLTPPTQVSSSIPPTPSLHSCRAPCPLSPFDV